MLCTLDIFSLLSFQPGDGNTTGRLLTPEEGCGLTKVKHARIVGGSKAENGIMFADFSVIKYKTKKSQ